MRLSHEGQQNANIAMVRHPAKRHGAWRHAYLDKNGKSTYDDPVEMFLFASGKFDPADKLVAVNLLRISESDYRAFLGRWVGWLVASGIAGELAA